MSICVIISVRNDQRRFAVFIPLLDGCTNTASPLPWPVCREVRLLCSNYQVSLSNNSLLTFLSHSCECFSLLSLFLRNVVLTCTTLRPTSSGRRTVRSIFKLNLSFQISYLTEPLFPEQFLLAC